MHVSFWISFGVLLAASCQARPESGYNYQPPQPLLSESQSSASYQQTLPAVGQSQQQNVPSLSTQPQLPYLSQSQSSASYQLPTSSQSQQNVGVQFSSPTPNSYSPPSIYLPQTGQSYDTYQQSYPNQAPPQINVPQSQGGINYASPQYLQFLPPGVAAQNLAPLQIQASNPILIPNFQFQKYPLQSAQSFNQLQVSAQPIQQQVVPQGSFVTKNVYVHVAPEEPPLPPQVLPAPPAPRKNYKIIFIKAPSQSSQRQVIHVPAPQAPTEEKTLVYVLVDRPQRPQVVVPSPTPTQSSKPEVYFIKYKANSAVPAGAAPAAPQQVSSGASTSSLFSSGASAPTVQYGPAGYQKRSA